MSDRPRLAYCSPLPPSASVVADYAVALLPSLAERFDVELYVAEDLRPTDDLARDFPVRPLSSLHRAPERGAVLYHLANQPRHHAEIYRRALELPGLVVFHETALHQLVRAHALADGGPGAYYDEMRYAYGRSGETTGRRFLELGSDGDTTAYALFERIVDSSLGVIVHDPAARRRVLASRPRAHLFEAPYPFRPSIGEAPPQPRTERLTLASFGPLGQIRRVEAVLLAYAHLRARHPEASLLLVGDPAPHRELAPLLGSELMRGVQVTSRLDREVDIALYLNHPSGGENPARLIHLLGAGKPVVLSNSGAFAALPDDCCARVEVDDREVGTLLATLLTLAEEPELRRRLGDAARAHVAAHHSPEATVEAYADALSAIEQAPPPRPLKVGRGIRARLVGDVGKALYDLGLEDERELPREVTRALGALGLDR